MKPENTWSLVAGMFVSAVSVYENLILFYVTIVDHDVSHESIGWMGNILTIIIALPEKLIGL